MLLVFFQEMASVRPCFFSYLTNESQLSLRTLLYVSPSYLSSQPLRGGAAGPLELLQGPWSAGGKLRQTDTRTLPDLLIGTQIQTATPQSPCP